jgi:heptosyltransferase-2
MDEVSSAARAPNGLSLDPPPQRILVKEVNWLGDLVMSLPALHAIRGAFPAAQLSVLVKQDLAGFFDGLAWIDEVLPYRPAGGWRSLGRSYTIARELRSRRFDLAILFPNSFESALWVAMAGIPHRAGYATDGRGLLLNHRTTPSGDAITGHQTRYWLAIVLDTIGVRAASKATDHSLTASSLRLDQMRVWLIDQRRRLDSRLVAIAPAAAYGPAKEWPPERYAELIDLLHDRYDAECVLIGSNAERSQCERVATSARAGAIVAAGALGLGEQIALLSLADGFVGNDSGPMHLAAALGIPTVGIFGSTNPERTGPIGPRAGFILHPPACNPCLARTCRYGHYDCLRAVSVAEVAEMLDHLGAFGLAQSRNITSFSAPSR